MSSSPPAEPVADRPWSADLLVAVRRLLPRTLTGRLIISTLVLVALVSVVVGTVTTLALRQFLLQRLDEQLISATQRRDGPFGLEHIPGAPCAIIPPGDEGGFGVGLGQSAGTLLARFDAGCRSAVVITERGQIRGLGIEDRTTLADLAASSSPQSVALSIGSYRVLVNRQDGSRLVTGVPTANVDDTVRNLILREGLVALAGVMLAGAIGSMVIRHQLSPLRRVAATATEVTGLPLGSGDVAISTRVPAELTDPETEVGQVGSALNAVLGHVDEALRTRQESEQRVRRFVADASHELRTPLATIMGYAELTRRASTDPDSMTHAMRRIHSESGRMADLVEDLLLLARLDSGRPLERADVDLSQLVAETVNDARILGPDHRFLLSLPVAPLHVTGDEGRLHQVLANLLTNAVRHTPPGTTVWVETATVAAPDSAPETVRVTVRDDGPGMPAALVGKEFERFSRGDSSRTRGSGGTGLGLSIVRAIVEAHGGRVRVGSDDRDGASGTTAVVELLAR